MFRARYLLLVIALIGLYPAPHQAEAATTPKAQTIGDIRLASKSISVGGMMSLSATVTSGLALTFSSTTPDICTVANSMVTAIAIGTCTVAADQAGNSTYSAAKQVTKSFTVTGKTQTISNVAFNPIKLAIGGTTTVSASASSQLAVSFSSNTASVCTVAGSTVTGVTTGTCTIAASQAGNSVHAAAKIVTKSINVTGPQTIGAISFNPTTVAIGGTTKASATASSGLAVKFSSTTTAICTVSGATVTGIAVGTCTIAADQAGNNTYSAAPTVTQGITVTGKLQTISEVKFTGKSFIVGGTAVVSASVTSGLALAFSSTTTNVCTVSGSTVTFLAPGTCTIAADQAGNATYHSAITVTRSITVVGKSQTITGLVFTPNKLGVGATTTVSATASSGLAVVFASNTPNVCTVSGSTVSGVAAGNCTIAASQPGDNTYSAASTVTKSVTVTKAQTIGAITFNPTTLAIGGTTKVSATASSTLAVRFSSVTPLVCTVSGSTVTGVAVGTCTIAADQVGNGMYSAATTVTQGITITTKAQTIGDLKFSSKSLTINGTTVVSAAVNSGLALTFSSTTPNICTVSGSTVTAVGRGTCIIAANQAGNSTYSAATTATKAILVMGMAQTIGAIIFNPTTLVVGGTTKATASASSGLAVTFNSSTPSTCAVLNGTVTAIAVGTCAVVASQGGNSIYADAMAVIKDITITKGSQTIGAIGFTPTGIVVGGSAMMIANATSGLAVIFTSQTPQVCTVTNNLVTAVKAGTCTVQAAQPGDSNWTAATSVSNSITVIVPKIVFTDQGDIFVMAADGSGVLQLTFGNTTGVSYDVARWSPDGTKILASVLSADGGKPDVLVMNADGTGATTLTNSATTGASYYFPVWSPDGKKILCTAQLPAVGPNPIPISDIDVLNVDGSGGTQLTNSATTGVFYGAPQWFPDGTKILFTANAELAVMNADGSAALDLTNGAMSSVSAASAVISPDGTKIAYVSSAFDSTTSATSSDIAVMNSDGSGQALLTNSIGAGLNYTAPVWSPNGTKLLFAATSGTKSDVVVMNANGAAATTLTNSASSNLAYFTPQWSPDGAKILLLDTSLTPGSYVLGNLAFINADGSSLSQVALTANGSNRIVLGSWK